MLIRFPLGYTYTLKTDMFAKCKGLNIITGSAGLSLSNFHKTSMSFKIELKLFKDKNSGIRKYQYMHMTNI